MDPVNLGVFQRFFFPPEKLQRISHLFMSISISSGTSIPIRESAAVEHPPTNTQKSLAHLEMDHPMVDFHGLDD